MISLTLNEQRADSIYPVYTSKDGIEICSGAVRDVMGLGRYLPKKVRLDISTRWIRNGKVVTFAVTHQEVFWNDGHLILDDHESYEAAWMDWGDTYASLSDWLIDGLFDGKKFTDFIHVYVRFKEVK